MAKNILTLIDTGPLFIGQGNSTIDCLVCNGDVWVQSQDGDTYFCIYCFDSRALNIYRWLPEKTKVKSLIIECGSCDIASSCSICFSENSLLPVSCFVATTFPSKFNKFVMCTSCKMITDQLVCHGCNVILSPYSNITTKSVGNMLSGPQLVTLRP